MRRATTPTHIFTFPDNVDLSNIQTALISYSQCGRNVLEKNLNNAIVDAENNTLSVELTQEETNLFAPGKALVQVRVRTKNRSALASQMICFPVKPALNSEVME
jgi:hypothetical protein